MQCQPCAFLKSKLYDSELNTSKNYSVIYFFPLIHGLLKLIEIRLVKPILYDTFYKI